MLFGLHGDRLSGGCRRDLLNGDPGKDVIETTIDADGKGAGTTFNILAVLEGISSSQLTSCRFVA
jgi:hypothetical protein